MARAAWSDVSGSGPTQGASTITEQFVKNALTAQNNRTIFEKLREAALAYHLDHRWSKHKILDQYLNTIYFGNGAYGVEAAVRTYFGGPGRHYGHAEHLAKTATIDQAALLAGMIASPGLFDPIQNPGRSRQRRDIVLHDMLQQRLITPSQYATALAQPIPTEQDLNPAPLESDQPYFSSWVTQQLVDRYGAGTAFDGGLKVTTSLDPQLQNAAEQAINSDLAGVGPSASMVAIDNATGEVKAMVGGNDYRHVPFNLATNGHRQPGSAMKAFVLAAALQRGVSPDSVWASHPEVFHLPDGEKFVVRNFQNSYSGEISLANATAVSDNSVFAAVGMQVGTKPIAQLAERMGIRTPLSTNPAMVLGGLKEGVTPLEMAYAYSTIANGGRRISGSLASSPLGPVAVAKVQNGGQTEVNRPVVQRVLSPGVAESERQILRGVVLSGTAVSAQVSDWAAGKTGTTENYGDAWFVGFTNKYTVAVWVGYPNRLKPMLTEWRGQPVEGGTYPALIWHDFMTQAIAIDQSRHPNQQSNNGGPAPLSSPVQSSPSPAAPTTAQTTPQGAAGPTTAPQTPSVRPQSPPIPTHTAPPPLPPAQRAPTAPPPTTRGGATPGAGGR